MKNETAQQNTKGNTEIIPEQIESKYAFFDTFIRGFGAISAGKEKKNSESKYKNKIQLPIIETFLLDNGQIIAWLFTDMNGYVMKKSTKKLHRDNIFCYFIRILVTYLKESEDITINKTDSEILIDITRFTAMIDQKIDMKLILNNLGVKYLEHFIKQSFLLVYFGYGSGENSSLQLGTEVFFNIIELSKILNDANKVPAVVMIQNCMHAKMAKGGFGPGKSVAKLNPLIIKYSQKSQLAPKKFEMFFHHSDNNTTATATATSNEDMKNLMERIQNKSLEDNTHDKANLILLNNSILAMTMEKMITPFIKLLEHTKQIQIVNAFFHFVKVKIDGLEHYVFQLCCKVSGISKQSQKLIEHEKTRKSTMLKIFQKTIPKDLLPPVMTGQSSTSASMHFHKYEKITKNAFCFGEFCEYSIPKFFKNLKKNTKVDDINTLIIPSENKFTGRDKMHNLPNSLPVFQIKKAYDNPVLVNIVLKAYSIFPKNFDKDSVLQQILKERKQEEEKKKQKEKEREEKKKKIAEMKKRGISFDNKKGLRLNSNSNVSEIVQKKNESCECENLNLMNRSLDSNEDGESTLHEPRKRTQVTLYTPTPNKFEHINHDSMYNKKYVCNNCFKIYMLIHNFLSNIDETTAQFKSLSKAKDLLMQGDKLQNPGNYQANDDEEPRGEDNLLFQEEVQEFSLKKILKRNLRKQQIENEKKLKKKKEKVKIARPSETRKDEFRKTFSYKLNINPRLLRFNLIAEKTKNKFFNLIFNELKVEPESVYQKLGIKKPDKTANRSMKSLRMHMGINSHIYNPDVNAITGLVINNELAQTLREVSEIPEETIKSFKKALETRETLINQQREVYQIDNDLFLSYKNIIKRNGEDFISPFLSIRAKDEKKIGGEKRLSNEENNESDNDTLKGFEHSNNGLSKISEDDHFATDSLHDDEEEEEEEQPEMEMEMQTKILNDNNRKLQKLNTVFPPKKSTNNETSIKIFRKSLTQENIKHFLNIEKLQIENPIMENEKKNQMIRLEKFVTIKRVKTPSPEGNGNRRVTLESKNSNQGGNDKKIQVSSIFYYDRSKDANKLENPYFYISTPMTKINEVNFPILDNPLLLTQNMTCEDYQKIGKFENSPLLENSNIFVYDTFTAIPYKVIEMKNPSGTFFAGSPKAIPTQRDSIKKNFKKLPTHILKEGKSSKVIVLVLNDFFDSFTKYQQVIQDIFSVYESSLDVIKLVFFNFPGQSSTMFSKKVVFNNMYYCEFLDRLIFHLHSKEYFDHSYHLILIGFGNGGHVALTYSSCYEKYWDFLHSLLLFNSYCENDEFINQSMLEILKIIETSKNVKLVDFFIKSITVNPQKLYDIDKNLIQEQSNNININNKPAQNQMTMSGYHNITRGYFFNVKINLKEILSQMVVVHSNQNCFITINNINSIFLNKTKIYSITKGNTVSLNEDPRRDSTNSKVVRKEMPELQENLKVNAKEKITSYDFEELMPESKFKRKLIVVDGSHDISMDDQTHLSDIIHSYMRFLLRTNSFQGALGK